MGRTAVAGCLFSVSMAICGWVGAQDFPARPVRMIVPDTPGGGIDTHARIMAGAMSPILGQPVVVENKPGAAYAIGLDYVAKRVPADGYTVAIAFVQALVVLPLAARNLTFDPLADLPPFIGLTESRTVLCVSQKHGWKTAADMVAYAKANPGKLGFGSNGVLAQIMNEAVLQGLGFTALDVPFSSGGAAMQALVAGQIDAQFVSSASARNLGKSVQVVAVTGAKQTPDYPGVPTLRELGLDNLEGLTYTINAPTATPAAAVAKLHAAASQSIRQPDVRARLEKLAVEVAELDTDTARRKTLQQAKFYAELAKKIGIKPQ